MLLQPDRVAVRVLEALDAGVKLRQLLLAAGADLVERWRVVDALAAAVDGDEELGARVAERLAPRHVRRIDDGARRRAGQLVPDHVAAHPAIDREAPHLQHARGGDLNGLLGELDLVLPGAPLRADGGELVDAAKS